MTRTLALFAALTLLSTTAAAQESIAPLQRALRSADVIMEAELVEVRPRWVEGLIVSEIRARPTRCVLGSCPSRDLRFEVLGGELDGVVQVISGSTVHRAGERALLSFVQRNRGLQLLSPSLGLLPIISDRSPAPIVASPYGAIDLDELRQMVGREGGRESPHGEHELWTPQPVRGQP